MKGWSASRDRAAVSPSAVKFAVTMCGYANRKRDCDRAAAEANAIANRQVSEEGCECEWKSEEQCGVGEVE
jgi:hypothetical protein